jgi:plasmid stabilization system protein ParE
MQVEITAFARLQLKQIFAYYKVKASERVALKIIEKLLDSMKHQDIYPALVQLTQI